MKLNLREGKKNEGVVEWIVITSPEDLFKHNIEMNFEKLGFRPLMINHEFDNESEMSASK